MPESLRPKLRLEHLTFTGDGLEPAGIEFAEGLTIVYGGSNAGKSYSLQVLDFMLGGSPPDVLEQGAEYTRVLLGLTLGDGRQVTLERARRGAGFKLYEGLAKDGDVSGRASVPLAADHGKGKFGSVSEVLLESIGIKDAKIAATEAAQLIPFSIRHFMPYIAVNEDRMFTADSPTIVSPKNGPTLNKNVFRFILTGQDDRDVIEVPNEKALKASNDGKVELLEEMIADIDGQIAEFDTGTLDQDIERLGDRLEDFGNTLGDVQQRLDTASRERRGFMETLDADRFKLGQLVAMKARFLELRDTYSTDIRRLEAIEEGGFLLQRFENQPCPMCGALPGDQHLPHELGDLDRQHAAARAEIAKIQRDMRGLEAALAGVETEQAALNLRIEFGAAEVRDREADIARLKPQEANTRRDYQTLAERLAKLEGISDLRSRRAVLQVKRDAIAVAKVGRQKADGLMIGIDGPTGHKFAQVVKDVLTAWEYPGIEAVTWDESRQDIAINGRPRSQNGKGVKAVFHSAFAVAVMIYCRTNRLPHPGFVVLDSPLVTYRKPIHYKRHGDLEADEKAIASTALDVAFYRHLAGLGELGQVYVIENNDPPSKMPAAVKIERFSGESGDGRQGLFPVRQKS
ncbi:hypothetical protein SAMN06295905_1594 [Devosia lucknowensis]|uniref:AAA domain-containing protein n=1 Tax=Devosia lucknowensis TaxID=1096929 RepID=A0A1Y6F1B7_9HYPH|nr:hypothetical protein [Devosia lucknowensis]SMQ68587.1 hypothetical protein SAMN06295905_1594 [Devosia lucknowensis]